MTKKISITLYYLNAIIAVLFGALYFLKSDLMSYHYAFMQMTAGDIEAFNPRILELMKALKKIVGAGLIGIGIGTFISTFFILKNQDNHLANILTFLMLMIPNTTLFLISYHVAQNIPTGATPPWLLSVVALVFIVVAFVLELIPDKSNQNKG